MTPELRGYFQVPDDRGLLVVRVEPDRPAARAGLRVGDVIVSAGGDPVHEPFDLIRIVAAAPAGEALKLGVFRDAVGRTLRVEPEASRASGRSRSASAPGSRRSCTAAAGSFGSGSSSWRGGSKSWSASSKRGTRGPGEAGQET